MRRSEPKVYLKVGRWEWHGRAAVRMLWGFSLALVALDVLLAALLTAWVLQ